MNQESYQTEKLTLTDCVNIFLDDDFRLAIMEKWEDLKENLYLIDIVITRTDKAINEVCDEIMEKYKLPKEDTGLYRALFKMDLYPLKIRKERLKREFHNIDIVKRAIGSSLGRKEVEDFALKVERAKEYSMESIYQGTLKKSNKNMLGCCPFHEEKTPSFYIFPDNHYHCFGCGVSGDSIDLYMKYHEVDFKGAVEALA